MKDKKCCGKCSDCHNGHGIMDMECCNDHTTSKEHIEAKKNVRGKIKIDK